MLQILSNEHKDVIAVKAVEKLTGEDYDVFVPALKAKIAKEGKIKLYFEMENFKGWDFSAFWRDAKFDFLHASDFEKIVMVGEKSWQEWMTQLMKPFTSGEVKYFDIADKEIAMTWINK